MAVNLKDLPASLQKQVMRKMNEAEAKKTGKTGETDFSTSLRSAQNDTGDGRPMTAPTRNKLHAEKCGKYASRHEAKRAWELKMLQRAGKISDLREQVKFVLIPAVWKEIPRTGKRGKPIKPKRVCVQRELAYVADFVYEKDGETVVEDAKGYKGGATYRIFVNKKKMMREKYGIEVREV